MRAVFTTRGYQLNIFLGTKKGGGNRIYVEIYDVIAITDMDTYADTLVLNDFVKIISTLYDIMAVAA